MDCGDTKNNQTVFGFCEQCPCKINTCYFIRKLVELLDDPIQASTIDRQLVILSELRRGLVYAYCVCDLPCIMRIIELMIEKRHTIPAYNEHIPWMISLMQIPPVLQRFSDLLTVTPDIEEYFSFIGYLIMALKDDATLQNLVIKSLWGILDPKTPLNIGCISPRVCQEAVTKSHLPEHLVHLLAFSDRDLYTDLLKLCARIADISETICIKMLRENILNTILIKLNPSWNKILENEETDSIHVLTNSLDKEYFKELDEAFELLKILLNVMMKIQDDIKQIIEKPNVGALESFRVAFQVLVLLKKQKLNRNMLMCFLLQIMDVFPELMLVKCLLVSDICILCAATDCSPGGTWAAEFRFTPDVEDYEFKKMLILSIHYFCRWRTSKEIFNQKQTIYSLVNLITPVVRVSWHPEHIIKLKCYALRTLEKIVPLLPNDFLKINGTMRITMLIEYFLIEKYNLELLQAAYRCIHELLQVPIIKTTFMDGTTEEVLFSTAIYIKQLKCISTPYQKILSTLFAISSIILPHKNELNVIKINFCRHFMTGILRPISTDIKWDPNLIICILDYTWNVSQQNQANFEYMMDHKFVYKLLDIIDDSAFPVKMVGLRILVDWCEYSKAIPYMITWRNHKTNLVGMLMKIFREENKLLKVKCSDRGVVNDANYPLMGELQKLLMDAKEFENSPAISDMEYSCRPKIYAILQLINARHKDNLEIANEEYKIFNLHMSVEDQITKLLCDHYFTIKLGEAWLELDMHLKNNSIQPVPMDNYMMKTVVKNYYKWGTDLQRMQNELLRIDYKNENKLEEEFYNILREAKLESVLHVLLELRLIARTTESIFRLTKKMITSSRFDPPTMHRTSVGLSVMSNEPVKYIKNRITIQSDKIIQIHEVGPTEPISPQSSLMEIHRSEYSDIL